MSLIDFIEKVQRKPRYIRIQILWFSVIVFMFLIVSFWVVSLKQTFPKTAETKDTKEEIAKESKGNLPTLGETLKASIGGFFKKDGLEKLLENEMEKEESPSVKSGSRSESIGKETKPSKLPISY